MQYPLEHLRILILLPKGKAVHPKDDVVPFGSFDAALLKLEKRIEEAGLVIPSDSPFAVDARRAFATLYYSIFATERPSTSPAETLVHGASLAGLGDMAAKLNMAMDRTDLYSILPHIVSMLKGSIRMNAWSGVLDQAANKTTELYVGALAIGAGLRVELEDPVNSAQGQNPDILLTRAGRDWAIAVKTPHSAGPRSIWGNIETAVKQIQRSGRTGITLLNLKNVIDRKALLDMCPFPSVNDAINALRVASGSVIDAVRSETAESDWDSLFKDSLARPLVAYMTQVTLSAVVPDGRTLFVPIKELRLRFYPPLEVADLTELTGVDAEARNLVHDLNEQLQANPNS